MGIEVIAEVAQGFEGRSDQARLLIRAAAAARADAVKFQLVIADELATNDYVHYGLFSSLELPDEDWQALRDFAQSLGIQFFLDIFGPQSLGLAERVRADAVKIHATDMANSAFLERVSASECRNVILGAGGATREEILSAAGILREKEVTVLIGFQGYPTSTAANQLARIAAVRELVSGHRQVRVGFADHADPEALLGLAISAAAIGMGATVVEKHITLGREMHLEDHEAALNPDEFGHFVDAVRQAQSAIGVASQDSDFGMSKEEQDYRLAVRRHVVAARDLSPGKIIETKDLALKRSSSASAVTSLDEVAGRRLRLAKRRDEPFAPTDVDGWSA